MSAPRLGLPHMEPPPGGERRLRQALRAAGAERPLRWRHALAFTAACATIAFALPALLPPPASPQIDAALRTAWDAPPTTAIENGGAEVVVDTAAVRVVLIAQVESTRSP